MRIKKFKFDDLRADWHLEETAFDSVNLLVGSSGAGKTKILEALRRVCRIATEGDYDPGQVEWMIEFEQGGEPYRWEGRTERKSGGGASARRELCTVFLREGVTVGETTRLIERNQDAITLDGAPHSGLDKEKSALFLLKESSAVAPILHAFNSVMPSAATSAHPLVLVPGHAESIRASIDDLRSVSTGKEAFESFREGWAQAGLSALAQAILMVTYYIQEVFPEQFREVEQMFTAIFPSVRAVKVSGPSGPERIDDAPGQTMEWNLQEVGSDNRWIPQAEISAGMLRALVHLFEIYIAPPGSVVLIDDLENSLGSNCLPELMRFMMSRTSELQLVLTSHRPDVIERVPIDAWKVVTRTFGRVCVKSARDIAALSTASHHEAFLRLMPQLRLAGPVA